MARIIDGDRKNVVGENIKRARIAANMSQKQLAEILETYAIYVCRGSISRIESGDRTVTDIEVCGFAQALKIGIDDLFAGISFNK